MYKFSLTEDNIYFSGLFIKFESVTLRMILFGIYSWVTKDAFVENQRARNVDSNHETFHLA